MLELILAVMMLAAIALAIGAIVLFWRGTRRTQPVLMLVLAIILGVNVLIWTMPNSRGLSPASAGERAISE